MILEQLWKKNVQTSDGLSFSFFDRKPGRSLAGERGGMLTRYICRFDSLPDAEGSGEERFLSRPTPLATFQSFFASFLFQGSHCSTSCKRTPRMG